MVSRNPSGPDEPVSPDVARQVREELRRRSSPWTFQTFFEDTVWTFHPPNLISISAPTRYRRTLLENRYLERIRDAARAVLGREVDVVFEGLPGGCAARELSDLDRIRGPRLAPDLTFDTFVPGPASRVAHAAALAVTERPGKDYNPLFICGPPSAGKSHLLQAICQRLRERKSLHPVLLSSHEFLDLFTAAVEKKSVDGFRERFRDADLLAIDDFHFLAKKESTQEELFRTFDAFLRERRQIVIATAAHPLEIDGIAARMGSRFKGSLVAPLRPPELEARLTILAGLASRRNRDLPMEVAQLIASRAEENPRELEGGLLRVLHVASTRGLPLDLETARRALEELPDPERRGAPSVPSIRDAVMEHFLVKEKDIVGPSRKRMIVLSRQIAMFLSRELTPRSLVEIGAHFGNRDHSTVLHAVRRIRTLAAKDSRIRSDLAALKSRILPNA